MIPTNSYSGTNVFLKEIKMLVKFGRLIIACLLIILTFLIQSQFFSSIIINNEFPFILNYHNQLWSTLQIYSYLLFFLVSYTILILLILRKVIALIPFLSFSIFYFFLAILILYLKYGESDLQFIFLLASIVLLPISIFLFFSKRNVYFEGRTVKSKKSYLFQTTVFIIFLFLFWFSTIFI